MKISKSVFESWVKEAIDNLPENVINHMNNIVIFVSEKPTEEQKKKLNLRRNSILFGLYEGYHQSMKLNTGPVLPDQITIFSRSIINYAKNKKEIKEQITNTIKHEIAHHFGSDETGAKRAGSRK